MTRAQPASCGATRRYPEIWLRRHEIDVGRRELKIANEESIGFSRLVLATGSTPAAAERCRRRSSPGCIRFAIAGRRSVADARRAEGRVVVMRRHCLDWRRLRPRQGGRIRDAAHLMDRLMSASSMRPRRNC